MRVELRATRGVAVAALIFAMVGGTATLLPGGAAADQWYAAGPRHQAMGGTGVATVRDSLASYWNPAAPALVPAGWDVHIPITFSGSIEQDALSSLGDLYELGGEASDALGCLTLPIPDSCASRTPLDVADDVRSLIKLVAGLPTLGKDGQSFQSGINLGLIGRYNKFTFGVLSNTGANVQPVFDSALNLALSRTPGNLPADAALRGIQLLGAGPFTRPMDAPMDADLVADILAVAPTAFGNDRAEQLVFLALTSGVDTTDPRVENIILNAAKATEIGEAALDVNASGAFVRGLSTQEFAVGYAYLVPMPFFKPLDGKVSVGANLKYMLGVSYTRFVDYDDADDFGDALDLLLDKNNVVTSHNFGIDLGLMVAPWDWLRIGLTARNINSPSFDAAGVGDDSELPRAIRQREKKITLDAQVRAGLALMPLKNLTLAMDVDLTENKGLNLPGFKSRLISFGAEYVVPFPFTKSVDLALRGGAFNNIADGGFNDNWAITMGFGLRLWNFIIDASGGLSTELENFSSSAAGNKIPNRVMFGVGLKYEKRF